MDGLAHRNLGSWGHISHDTLMDKLLHPCLQVSDQRTNSSYQCSAVPPKYIVDLESCSVEAQIVKFRTWDFLVNVNKGNDVH